MSERSLGLNRGWAQAADGPVDRGTADAEQLGQFGRAVGAGVAELEQVPGLVDGQLRLLPAQPSLGLGDLHALLRPHPDQVRLNSATIANTLNSSRPIGSVGSCTEPPK